MDDIKLPEANTALYVLQRMKEYGDLPAMVRTDF